MQGLSYLAHVACALLLLLLSQRLRLFNLCYAGFHRPKLLSIANVLEEGVEISFQGFLRLIRCRKLSVELVILVTKELRDVCERTQVYRFVTNTKLELIIITILDCFFRSSATKRHGIFRPEARPHTRGPPRRNSTVVLSYRGEGLVPSGSLIRCLGQEMKNVQLECLVQWVQVKFLVISLG